MSIKLPVFMSGSIADFLWVILKIKQRYLSVIMACELQTMTDIKMLFRCVTWCLPGLNDARDDNSVVVAGGE